MCGEGSEWVESGRGEWMERESEWVESGRGEWEESEWRVSGEWVESEWVVIGGEWRVGGE